MNEQKKNKESAADPRSLKPCDVVLLNGEEKMVTQMRKDGVRLDGCFFFNDELNAADLQMKKKARLIELKVRQKWERRDEKTVEIVGDDGSGLPMVDSSGGWFFRNNPLKEVTSPSHAYDLIRMVQDEHGNSVSIGWYEEGDEAGQEPKEKKAKPMKQKKTETKQRIRIQDLNPCDVVRHDGKEYLVGMFDPNDNTVSLLDLDGKDYNWYDSDDLTEATLVKRARKFEIKIGQCWERRDGLVVEITKDDDSDLPMRSSEGDWYFRNSPLNADFQSNARHDLIRMVQDENGNEVNIGWYEEDDTPATEKKKSKKESSKKHANKGTLTPFKDLKVGDLVWVNHCDVWCLGTVITRPAYNNCFVVNRETELACEVEAGDEVYVKGKTPMPKLVGGQRWKRRDGEIITIEKDTDGDWLFCADYEGYDCPFSLADEDFDLVELLSEQEDIYTSEKVQLTRIDDNYILTSEEQALTLPTDAHDCLLGALVALASREAGQQMALIAKSLIDVSK